MADVIIDRDLRQPAEGFNFGNPSRFRRRQQLAGGNCFLERLPGIPQKVAAKGQAALSSPDRSRVGICLPGRHDHAVSTSGKRLTANQANFAAAPLQARKATGRRTTPVGSFSPNAWGLYDMHGNVAQWCQDRFGPYPNQHVVDPQGAEKGGSRVLRGGSWEDGPGRCRSACRAWDSPDNRRSTFGFRVCFTVN